MSPNSYVDILSPNGMVVGGGTFNKRYLGLDEGEGTGLVHDGLKALRKVRREPTARLPCEGFRAPA